MCPPNPLTFSWLTSDSLKGGVFAGGVETRTGNRKHFYIPFLFFSSNRICPPLSCLIPCSFWLLLDIFPSRKLVVCQTYLIVCVCRNDTFFNIPEHSIHPTSGCWQMIMAITGKRLTALLHMGCFLWPVCFSRPTVNPSDTVDLLLLMHWTSSLKHESSMKKNTAEVLH